MNEAPISHPYGFGHGLTVVIRLGRDSGGTGIGLSILKLDAGETQTIDSQRETAALLLTGTAVFGYASTQVRVARTSIFNENPSALHCSGGEAATIIAESPCEFAIIQTGTGATFPTSIFTADALAGVEDCCKGVLEDTAHRLVRTVFSHRTHPQAGFTLGEVVAFPGSWSGYPPHHHPQAEIQHYRFTRPQGYGHAELGSTVHKIGNNDTLVVDTGVVHAQVAAPGYGMYYLWAIRHLPEQPYLAPEFVQAHCWAFT